MFVPKQCIRSCNSATYLPDPEDMTLLIIGSILLGIILIVLVCIITGIFCKKRDQNEKLKRLISPNSNRETLTPSYRNMAFIDNMEGTVDSLERYRRNPTFVTTSPMMPLPAAYQQGGLRPNSSSVMLVDADENGQNVPVPANYKTPTQEQLESSRQSLSAKKNSIHSQIRRKTSLPGTPE